MLFVADGAIPAQTVKGGTYYTVDLSSVAASDAIEIDTDVELYALVAGTGTGMDAYVINGTANKWFRSTVDTAGSGTAVASNALDFGTAGFSVEAWATMETSATLDHALWSFGRETINCVARLVVNTSSNALTFKFGVGTDSAATTLIDLTTVTYDAATFLSGLSTRPIHSVMTVDRAGTATSASSLKLYLNGQQVVNHAFTDTAPTQNINVSNSTDANAGVHIGTNHGGARQYPGRIYAVRAYKSVLTQQQVIDRGKLGPTNLPVDGTLPSWILRFDNRSSWVSALQPEAFTATGTKVTTFGKNGSAVAADDFVKYAGGEFPTAVKKFRIPAGSRATLFRSGRQAKNQLVLYPLPQMDSGVGGVTITRVVADP